MYVFAIMYGVPIIIFVKKIELFYKKYKSNFKI